MVTVKRGVLVFGCAVAFAVAPLVVASPAAADKTCPWGTRPGNFPGICVSGATGGQAAVPVAPSAGGVNIGNNGGLATVNGIPCTPEHFGTCYGLIQNGG